MNPCTTLTNGITRLGDPMPPTAPKLPMTIKLKSITAAQPADKKPNAPQTFIDPAALQVTDDPLPASRTMPTNKYFPTFDRMKLGQSVRCATSDVGKVSGALRKYISVKAKKGMIKSVTRYVDPRTQVEDTGYGRVWMLPVAGKALKVAA